MNTSTSIKRTGNSPGNTLAAAVAVAGMAMAPGLATAGDDKVHCSEFKDAWINGSVETTFALNPHLSALDIDTKVNNCQVILKGVVESGVQQDLAAQLAKRVNNVASVENQLTVKQPDADKAEKSDDQSRRSAFGTWVSDATIGATVKTKLLANDNVDGTAINVEVEDGVVMLNGLVHNGAEADLAVLIARNTDNVREVRNNLEHAS